MFDTAVENPYRFPPRWLNEGLAVYLSEGYGSGDQNRVADAVEIARPHPAHGARRRSSRPTPTRRSSPTPKSVSAIDYLVREHGQDAMVALVVAYKDGLTDDEAFTTALGVDVATFQAGWLDGPRRAAAGAVRAAAQPAGTAAVGLERRGAQRRARPDRPDVPTRRHGRPRRREPEPDPGAAGASTPLLVGGLVLVVAVVIGGLVVAKRRSGTA